MTLRKFRLFWKLSSMDQRCELVKRWYDLVYFEEEDVTKTAEQVSEMHYLDLPISLIHDLSQDHYASWE